MKVKHTLTGESVESKLEAAVETIRTIHDEAVAAKAAAVTTINVLTQEIAKHESVIGRIKQFIG